VRPRELLAPALLAARTFAPAPPPGAWRNLLLHDIPRHRYDDLARLLDHVAARHGFIAPSEVITRKDGPLRCVLNFDDGFKGNRDVAERLLAPRGIRAIFFVNPGLIESQTDDTYMSWDDLAALARAGHVIGAHGQFHVRLAGLPAYELEAQIVRAREALTGRLGAPDWFAYPFGDIDSVDAAALHLIGRHYRHCRSGVRGLNVPATHRLAVLADNVELDAGWAWQKLTVAGGLDGHYEPARARLLRMAESASRS
jgi:peptidoglycan/xylan/chitin deacetylase (PgdA/CDA1 family)